MKKLRFVSTFGVLVVLLLVVATSAYGGQTKVDVCHITGTHDFGDGQGEVPIGHVINIADPAYDSHIAHGDPEVWNVVTLDDGSEVCTAWIETPDTEKTVFVTSGLYDGDLGGLEGADAICQGLANAAGLEGTYKAWLSTDSVNAADRLTHSTVPYKRVDGVTIASDWADLTDGSLLAPIDVDENGDLIDDGPNDFVWTATGADGAYLGWDECADWTYNGSGDANQGYSHYVHSGWSDDTLQNCEYSGRLYCFEQ